MKIYILCIDDESLLRCDNPVYIQAEDQLKQYFGAIILVDGQWRSGINTSLFVSFNEMFKRNQVLAKPILRAGQ